MADMARAAVDCGMLHYGFTPHSPIPFDSPCNMAADAVEEYIIEAERIRKSPDLVSCRFYTGMEIDYIDSNWGPANEYFRGLPLDYSIGSVHFIPTQSGEPVDIDGRFDSFRRKMADRFRGDIDYVVDTFFSHSLDMIDAGGFDILGHFDKIGLNASYYAPGIEDGQHYKSMIAKLIETIIEHRLTIELNTKSFREHGRFFPGERYLPELAKSGITILVNSDAHYPDRITASRKDAFDILDRCKA